jgi:hypothetical protein
VIDAEEFYEYESDQMLDAMVFLGDEVPEEKVREVIEIWKLELEDGPWESSGWTGAFGATLPSRKVGHVVLVSRYRFREKFKIPQFEEAFEEVEAQTLTFLMGQRNALPLAFTLWLIRRSKGLVKKTQYGIDLALKRICSRQQEGKWWDSINVYTTALCALALLKRGTPNEYRRRGVSAAGWLCDHQGKDGSWPEDLRPRGKVPEGGDILTTLLCLEVLIRSEIENVEKNVERGTKWLLDQQDALGLWDSGFFPFPFVTVLVLEFLEKKEKGEFEIEEVEIPGEAADVLPKPALTPQQKDDYKNEKYKTRVRLHVSGNVLDDGKPLIRLNDRELSIDVASFILLLWLVQASKKEEHGWIGKSFLIARNVLPDAADQAIARLRTCLSGGLGHIKRTDFIEAKKAPSSKGPGSIRISTHPDFITYDKQMILKQFDDNKRIVKIAEMLP